MKYVEYKNKTTFTWQAVWYSNHFVWGGEESLSVCGCDPPPPQTQ